MLPGCPASGKGGRKKARKQTQYAPRWIEQASIEINGGGSRWGPGVGRKDEY